MGECKWSLPWRTPTTCICVIHSTRIQLSQLFVCIRFRNMSPTNGRTRTLMQKQLVCRQKGVKPELFCIGRLLGYLFLCSNDELAAMCAFRMANWNSLATNGAKGLSSRLSTWNGKIDSVPILSSSWLQDRKAERPCRQLPYYVTLCEPSVFGPSLSAWLQLLPFSVVPRLSFWLLPPFPALSL